MKGKPTNKRINTLWQRFTHGFTATQSEGCECLANYEQARGVSIRIVDLCKSFDNHQVLKKINLDVSPGETFSIIGPSGTGKSVLLKHVVRLERPDSGTIFIDDVDIFNDTFGQEGRNYRCSMVFQSAALFNSLSVGDNVGLWLREKRICTEARIRRIIREKLRLVGLSGTENKMVSELSGGMKKRVAIARSLAMNPDLILYDEPTAELDPVTTDELARVIIRLKETVKSTTVIVTHDLNFALYLSDRIAMITPDGIVEVGTPSQIRSSQNPVVRNFIYTTTKGIKEGDE